MAAGFARPGAMGRNAQNYSVDFPCRMRSGMLYYAMLSGTERRSRMNKEQRKQAATALGRLGGKARAKNLSPEERSAGAKKAAQARWQAKQKGETR